MQRRTAIKNLLLLSGGVWGLYSFTGRSVEFSDISRITADELKLVSDLCNAIIPPTNTPGAGDLGAHLFVIRILEDCRPPGRIQSFKEDLKNLLQYARATTGKPWNDLKGDQKLNLLQALVKDKEADKSLRESVQEVRKLTIQGYSNSKFVMTKLVSYQLAPGYFKGCVPVRS